MNSGSTFWGAAAISIVIVSWFFYRTLVPKSWKEWARAGIVQAFIIAFYAEMYGFPVTIYALTRMFGLDVSGSFWDGNLWIYLTGTPAAMLVSMTIGYAIAFFGIVLVSAGWREVYRARKENRLASEGPYVLVRHPQYTGFFLVMFGEGVVHWPTVFSLAAFPIVVIAYVLLARREEREWHAGSGTNSRHIRNRYRCSFRVAGSGTSCFGSRHAEVHKERRTYGPKSMAVDRDHRVSGLLLFAHASQGAARQALEKQA